MSIEDTAVQGFNMNVSLNGHDVSGQSNKVSLEVAKQIDDVTPFGVTWKLQGSGLKSWSGSLDIFYNEEADEGTEAVWEALDGTTAVELVITPSGIADGNWTFTGNVHIESLSIEASPDGGFQMVSVGLEGTGTLTKGVVSES